jgi:C4-type Zn-finger protein
MGKLAWRMEEAFTFIFRDSAADSFIQSDFQVRLRNNQKHTTEVQRSNHNQKDESFNVFFLLFA